MNITILSLRGPTKKLDIKGGAIDYIQEVAKYLVSEGNKVTILCGAEPKNNLYDSENIDGVNIVRVGNSRWSIKSIWKYYKENLRESTDILIENMISFPMYGSLLKKNEKFYTIVHHLSDKEYFKTHNILIATLGYFMEKVTLRILYKGQKFIAVSDYTKGMLIKNGIKSENIDIVNPGMRENFFEAGEKSNHPLIFYVGRYSAYGGNKKVDHLIEAYKEIQKKYPDAELIIGGKGEGIEVLREQSKGLNVKFIGPISDEEKRSYMQKAWIFASPSLAEGFGITWIEANACGTPVVGYKIEGLNTVDDKSSRMVELGNINQLYYAMLNLINDKELRLELSNNGVEHAKKFGWSKVGEKFLHKIKKDFNAVSFL